MIEPQEADIGRRVIFRSRSGETEGGVITSFNHAYVFVRYDSDQHSKGTYRKDLHWQEQTHASRRALDETGRHG